MIKLSIFLCFSFFYVRSERCPTDIETISPFDPAKYMGKWYELERYSFIFEAFQKCVTSEFALNSDGTVNVTNIGYTILGEYPMHSRGRVLADPQNPSNLTIYFGIFGSSTGGSYWVLDTDYDTYSLVYSCWDMPVLPMRTEYAWILGRDKNISAIPETIIENLKQRLTSLGSYPDKFSVTTQDCTFN